MLPTQHRETLAEAATIIVGGHSETAEGMLLAMMENMAAHHKSSGANSHGSWVLALRAMGETCLTLAKMIDDPRARR
jgi:hypothetical protein